MYNENISDTDVMSHVLYPNVFKEYKDFVNQYGDISVLDTRKFVVGLSPNEEAKFDIDSGKTLYITLKSVGDANRETGIRHVYFDMNGHQRIISVKDKSAGSEGAKRELAVETVAGSVGAPMPGVVVDVRVAKGEKVEKGDPLVVLSAMKMETVVAAPCAGKIKRVAVNVGDNISPGELTAEIEEN